MADGILTTFTLPCGGCGGTQSWVDGQRQPHPGCDWQQPSLTVEADAEMTADELVERVEQALDDYEALAALDDGGTP